MKSNGSIINALATAATAQPKITHFNVGFPKHTSFSTEIINKKFPKYSFGQKLSPIIIPRNGDRASMHHLSWNLPSLNQKRYSVITISVSKECGYEIIETLIKPTFEYDVGQTINLKELEETFEFGNMITIQDDQEDLF